MQRVWSFLAHTVLKPQLAAYFDVETDFARQLSSFRPNSKFEAAVDSSTGKGYSLASLVSEAKGRLGVEFVYAWHALGGYWRGISSSLGTAERLPVVQVKPKPSEHLLRLEPQLGWDPTVLFGAGLVTDPHGLAALFRGIHQPLAAAGCDGVKVR